MDKISPIKERILYYIDTKGITKKDFCKKVGISYNNLKGKSLESEFGGTQIVEILSIFSDISPDWLILGNGDMLRYNNQEHAVTCDNCKIIDTLNHTISIQNDFIASQKTQISDLRRLCKLVNQ